MYVLHKYKKIMADRGVLLIVSDFKATLRYFNWRNFYGSRSNPNTSTRLQPPANIQLATPSWWMIYEVPTNQQDARKHLSRFFRKGNIYS